MTRFRILDSSARLFAVLPKRRGAACACAIGLLLATGVSLAQVITIDREGRPVSGTESTVDRRYGQITPTKVDLSQRPLDGRSRADLIRSLAGEQGFAMRPFPRGHKGLTLQANGNLRPAGEAYLDMVTAQGVSSNTGDRLVITDIKFDHDKIVFLLNGGPDPKHRFLRHIQLGTGDVMNPVVNDDLGNQPMGSRLTLSFKGHVPELTGAQVKELLAPLISFNAKSPVEAFTQNLPPRLKQAILTHQVMVGMTTDMVLFAVGRPESKQREMDGQMPIEIWLYGKPPDPVKFVRINGNRVIRYEIAEVGKPPEVFTKDEVTPLLEASGTQLPTPSTTRTVAMGDLTRDPNTQAPAPPPTLRNPGETLPQDTDKDSVGTMRPVQFPKQKADDYPDATNLPRTHSDTEADDAKPAAPAEKVKKPAPQDGQPAPANPPAQTPPAAQQN